MIFVTPDRYGIVQRTVRSLQTQTIRSELEIILVAPSAADLHLDQTDLQDFHSYQVVEVGFDRSAGDTRVAGLKQAKAPIVAYLEDHAFPADACWAATLLESHQQTWGAVAPTLRNGNPESLISWASFSLSFGTWQHPQSPTSYTHLPWRNCSYRRSVLLEFGDELSELFIAESNLHHALINNGYRLYLDPRSQLDHLNFTTLGPMLEEQFTAGRVFAGARARNWSLQRRIIYLGGGVLLPLAKLLSLAPGLRNNLRERQLMPKILPALTLGLLAGCLGEWFGYLLGLGKSANWDLNKIEVSPNRQPLSGKLS